MAKGIDTLFTDAVLKKSGGSSDLELNGGAKTLNSDFEINGSKVVIQVGEGQLAGILSELG
jgi:hypothetical protein